MDSFTYTARGFAFCAPWAAMGGAKLASYTDGCVILVVEEALWQVTQIGQPKYFWEKKSDTGGGPVH